MQEACVKRLAVARGLSGACRRLEASGSSRLATCFMLSQTSCQPKAVKIKLTVSADAVDAGLFGALEPVRRTQ